MSQMFPQLDSVSISISPEVRSQHLAAVSKALSARRPIRRRFRLLAVAIAVLFALPVIALAAEDAEPGDFLYPVRQVLGWTDRAPSDEVVADTQTDVDDRTPTVAPTDDRSNPPVDREETPTNESPHVRETPTVDPAVDETRPRDESRRSHEGDEPVDRIDPLADYSPPATQDDRP